MSTEAAPQRFIVVFKDDVSSEDITKYVSEIQQAGGALKERWDDNGDILHGFAATIPEGALNNLQSLVGDVIAYIEPDGVATTQ